MNVGDLFELFIALAIILIGLFGSSRKKKPTPGARSQQATGRSPTRRPARVPQAPPTRSPIPDPRSRGGVAAEGWSTDPEAVARQIDRMLRGERPVPVAEADGPEEAQSLENVSIDETVRHRAFHEKYVDEAPVGHTRVSAARPGTTVTRISLQQAIIWREILGPPKGLE